MLVALVVLGGGCHFDASDEVVTIQPDVLENTSPSSVDARDGDVLDPTFDGSPVRDGAADATDGSPARDDVSGSSDTSSREPARMDFQIVNDLDEEVRLQVGVKGRAAPPGWLSLERTGGDRLSVESPGCEECICQALRRNGGTCPPVGRPCRSSEHVVRTLGPDETRNWTWSGATYTKRTLNGEACDRRRVPAPGDTLVATFCWSDDEGPTGSGVLLEQSDLECSTVPFRYGMNASVTNLIQ